MSHKSDDEEIRQKINVAAIISTLENHIINGTDMSATQVNAALALLKKTLPDISVTKETGKTKPDKQEILKLLKTHEEALKELE